MSAVDRRTSLTIAIWLGVTAGRRKKATPQRNLKSPETSNRAELMEVGGNTDSGHGNSNSGTGEPKRKRGRPSNASRRLLASISEQPENVPGDGGGDDEATAQEDVEAVEAMELDDDSRELQSLGMDCPEQAHIDIEIC